MPKDKKDKKRKHEEVEVDDAEPTTSLTTTTSSAKKEKKEKKRKSAGTEAVDADGDTIVGDAVAVVKKDEDEDEGEDERKERVKKVVVPLAALVPFANPLCDERSVKKVLKGVKKGIVPPTQPFISLSTPFQPTDHLTNPMNL